jgi:hypothetical protein
VISNWQAPAVRIEIEAARAVGERGQRYRVTYSGSVLIEGTLNPEFDACRALLAVGWRSGGRVSRTTTCNSTS